MREYYIHIDEGIKEGVGVGDGCCGLPEMYSRREFHGVEADVMYSDCMQEYVRPGSLQLVQLVKSGIVINL